MRRLAHVSGELPGQVRRRQPDPIGELTQGPSAGVVTIEQVLYGHDGGMDSKLGGGCRNGWPGPFCRRLTDGV